MSSSELTQLLTQLIVNACDAMIHSPQKSLYIQSWTDMDTESLIFTVRDTGCGMPPDVLERIYEPFFTTKGKEGMGLGLAYAFQVVQSHQGDITYKTEQGQGTEFLVRLPMRMTNKEGKNGISS